MNFNSVKIRTVETEPVSVNYKFTIRDTLDLKGVKHRDCPKFKV